MEQVTRLTWKAFKEKVDAAVVAQGGDPETIIIAYFDFHGYCLPDEPSIVVTENFKEVTAE